MAGSGNGKSSSSRAMSDIVVPSVAPLSLTVTPVLASPWPWTAGFDVILSVDQLPVSETRAMLTIGFVLSRVKFNVAVLVSPAKSVWLALNACAPSARPLGANLQLPR